MKMVAYCSPLIPPEWIAAHGLRPAWFTPGGRAPSVVRGMCPNARAILDAAPRTAGGKSVAFRSAKERPFRGAKGDNPTAIDSPAATGIDAWALLLTTTCDQLRRVSDLVRREASVPVFVFNVPVTWKTESSRNFYRDELERLSRFLVSLGGTRPGVEQLTEVMVRYQRSREAVLAARSEMSPRQFAEAVIALRGGLDDTTGCHGYLASTRRGAGCQGAISGADWQSAPGYWQDASGTHAMTTAVENASQGNPPSPPAPLPQAGVGREKVAIALVGGPLLPHDYELFDLVQRAGGTIVLDASETGERTLPAAWNPRLLAQDPAAALVEAYFGSIPDVFRRPNDPLYDWLGREMTARQVRGILFRRYVWCDLWHVELHRLRKWAPVPLVEIDVAGDEESVAARTEGRIEALLEMLGSASPLPLAGEGLGVRAVCPATDIHPLPPPAAPPINEATDEASSRSNETSVVKRAKEREFQGDPPSPPAPLPQAGEGRRDAS
jgi:hypothetical protein